MKATPIRVLFRFLMIFAFFMLMGTVARIDYDVLTLTEGLWRVVTWGSLALIGTIFSGALEWEQKR